MRRHFIWYGLAIGWAIAALAGFLRHHVPQAVPAAIFALIFAVVGLVFAKRDAAIRRKRLPHIN
jgi:uncharacterized membrane protein YfcA